MRACHTKRRASSYRASCGDALVALSMRDLRPLDPPTIANATRSPRITGSGVGNACCASPPPRHAAFPARGRAHSPDGRHLPCLSLGLELIRPGRNDVERHRSHDGRDGRAPVCAVNGGRMAATHCARVPAHKKAIPVTGDCSRGGFKLAVGCPGRCAADYAADLILWLWRRFSQP